MESHQQLTREIAKNHAVPAILTTATNEWLFQMHPRSGNRSALGNGLADAVAMPFDETRPDHQQLAVFHPVEKRTIGDISVRLGMRPDPRRLGGMEQSDRLAEAGAPVL